MFDSKVVDVGIGLVLMFFLLALASSSIVEAVAGVLNIRGKKLDAAIKQLVSDPQVTLNVWETSVFGAINAGTGAGYPEGAGAVGALVAGALSSLWFRVDAQSRLFRTAR